MQIRRRRAGTETSKFPSPADEWRSPLTSALSTVRDRLSARAVAAYVTGTRSNWLLLADHVIADADVGRPLEDVELTQELAGVLTAASTPIDGNRIPSRMFFDRNGVPEAYYPPGGGSCTWAPVRWDGRSVGGLTVIPPTRRGLSPLELTYLSTMACELAQRMAIQQLTVRYQRLGDTAARDDLVLMHMPLMERICKRFAGNNEAIDDLRQIGVIALLKAVRRYRPDLGYDFGAYATPCIVGELMNYYRDCGSLLKLPRSLRQLSKRIERLTQCLLRELGRFPTIDEISVVLEAPRQLVIEALQMDHKARPRSIDAEPVSEGAVKTADLLAEEDPDLEMLCDRITVRDAIARLDEVYKAIIVQRFYEGRSQAQIAGRLGISQAHVSRLQKSALLKIKMMLADGWL